MEGDKAMNGNGTRKFMIHIANTGEDYACPGTVDLLRGMEALSRKGIPVGCRGGGCGVCKVRIHSGLYHSLKMSRAYVSREEEAEGVVLACRTFPHSELHLQVLGKMVGRFEAHRPAATVTTAGATGDPS